MCTKVVSLKSWRVYQAITIFRLEIPIHFQPEDDFQSQEFSVTQKYLWQELPLRSDHPVSFRCAFTLPTSVTFMRGTSIPYFVVFRTEPRSPVLAKGIAADATISVSLVRTLTRIEKVQPPPLPPGALVSDEDDITKHNLLTRVRNGCFLSRTSSTSTQGRGQSPVEGENPLSRLPTRVVFSDTKILKNEICAGFPKRPCYPRNARKHPTLEEMAAFPDGLFRSNIPLKSGLLPSIDVGGLIVKYYLDVSVLLGQADMHARIPIRIL